MRGAFVASTVVVVTIVTLFLLDRFRNNHDSSDESPAPPDAKVKCTRPPSEDHVKMKDSLEAVNSSSDFHEALEGSGTDYGGGVVGGAQPQGSGGPAKMTAKEAAAAAGLRRRQAAASRVDPQTAERKRKAELIGKIESCYAAMHKEPPIGLGNASSLDSLQRHLDYVRKASADPMRNGNSQRPIFEFRGNTAGVSNENGSDAADGRQKMAEKCVSPESDKKYTAATRLTNA